ncbi:MAG: hypothetical protein APF78_03610 [Sphingomonadales bacterium BRH_c3]|nr:MAG: hypothetical protein APF78_03610 [Sphingomonadales bacterium BRH_c3]
MKLFLLAAIAAIAAMPATAQQSDDSAAVQAVLAAPQPKVVLPAGTEIPLKMSQTVTTKGKTWDEGDQFNLNVAANVMLGDYVVIPQGAKAVGRITWLTSKGAFGKSGKMEVELEFIELSGRRISLDGTYRQEGEGETLATVGGVVAAGPFAAFITGKSGVIPQGRELMATLESDLPVALPQGASLAPIAVQAAPAPGSEAAVDAQAAAEQRSEELAGERAAQTRPPAELKIGSKDE